MYSVKNIFRRCSLSRRSHYQFDWYRTFSLGNPMFIDRPRRPHIPDHSIPENTASGDAHEESDFLSNHGGKIALVGFSFAAALVYRWFIGGKNRTDLEEEITLKSPLHPYESNDLRLRNSMTCLQFNEFVTKCREKFPDGLATYDEFVRLFQQQRVCPLNDGYVIDRVILDYVEAKSPCSSALARKARFPVSFFLVALSNAVNSPPDNRMGILFDVAKSVTEEELNAFRQECNGNVTKDIIGDKSRPAFDNDNDYDGLYCEQDKVEALVGYLVGACQIPYEKMIQESGVYYPYKLYRRKTASEMVTQGIASLKPSPHQFGHLSVDEFSELLVSSSLCVWGECYRKG